MPPSLRLWELRAVWTNYYPDPDEGLVAVCERTEAVAFAVDDAGREWLVEIQADLQRGFVNNVWSEKRTAELRQLYPGFDADDDRQYEIVEVTHLLLQPQP
jgi:hypothetical protein